MTNTDDLYTEPSGRPYESSLRRAQAEGTRAAVLDAAAVLFVREGYLRTTMKAIAAEAGTSVETVYAQGGKAAIAPIADHYVISIGVGGAHALATLTHEGIENFRAVDAIPEEAGVAGIE